MWYFDKDDGSTLYQIHAHDSAITGTYSELSNARCNLKELCKLEAVPE